jgi:hypothetical protein
MNSPLIKALDKYIGEPCLDFIILFPPAWIAAPFFLMYWIGDMTEKACPIEMERMLKAAVGDEAALLRELFRQKGSKLRKYHLWKLREQLQRLPVAAAQNRISAIACTSQG